MQFLIYEVVSGGNLRKPGGLFGNTGSEIPVNELKQLESFFYKLSFFLHILDYTGKLLAFICFHPTVIFIEHGMKNQHHLQLHLISTIHKIRFSEDLHTGLL